MTKRWKRKGHPPSSVRSLCTARKVGRGGGSNQQRKGGAPPDQECTPFVRDLIQEMRGSPQDLQRPHTATRCGVEGARGDALSVQEVGGGAPPPH